MPNESTPSRNFCNHNIKLSRHNAELVRVLEDNNSAEYRTTQNTTYPILSSKFAQGADVNSSRLKSALHLSVTSPA